MVMLRWCTAAAVALMLALAGSGAAFAAALPVGENLIGITDGSVVMVSDQAGAIAAPVSIGSFDATDLAVDPGTGLIYTFDRTQVPCELVTVDPATGVRTTVGPISLGAGAASSCSGIEFDASGALWVIVDEVRAARVEVSNGTALEIHDITGTLNGISFLTIDSSGAFFVGDAAGIFSSVDAAWHATQALAAVVYAAAFDSTGLLWYLGPGSGCPTAVRTVDLADELTTATIGDLTDGAGCVDLFTLAMAPRATAQNGSQAAPQTLAETGVSAVPGALVGLLLLAAGFIVRRGSASTAPCHRKA